MRFSLALFGLCASLASAIEILSPSVNSTQATCGKTVVKWSTVDTDPSTFSIYLVNFVNWPPSYVPLAYNVPTADKSYTVQIPADTDPSYGYQINAINGTNVYVIYAQSKKFSVSKGLTNCVASNPTSTCPAPSTVTVTVSPTGLPSESSPATPPTTTAPPENVKPGKVPKTIGWCSGYSSPVTLSNVPAPSVAPAPLHPVTSLQNYEPQPTGVQVITTWVYVPC